MKRSLAALACAALVAAPSLACAQEPFEAPPSGVGLLVAGGIFTGIGGINLITSPICLVEPFDSSTKNVCLGASLGIGITSLVVGVPMLIVGVNQRRRYVEWKNRGMAGRLLDLGVAPAPGGGMLTWQGAF